ncbi:MAG: hypothetical protein ACR2FO_09605 [Actinomycetota bacterium]
MAHINEFGEIELDPDPYKNIPKQLAETLEAFVLVNEHDLALSRIDAIEYLLAEWDEVGEKSIKNWIQRHGDVDYILQTSTHGSLRRAKPGEHSGAAPGASLRLPKQLLSLLISEILKQCEIERIARIQSIQDLVAEWLTLYVDEEKLVGHLVRTHGVLSKVAIDGDEDSLIAMHTKLHQTKNNGTSTP